MMKSAQGKYSRIFTADLQILGSAFCFGIGFLGQRAVMVHGLGPMTCNAFRFGLSTIILVAFLPVIPVDEPEFDSDSDDETSSASEYLLESVDEADWAHSDDADKKKPRPSHPTQPHAEDASSKFTTSDEKPSKPKSEKKVNVLMMLLGPMANTRLGSIKKTVWFWGILLGLINFCASGFQQWGISLTSASKCAFIAGFDLFLTPVFSLLVPTSKQNALPSRSTWFAVSIALVGLFLLSGSRLDDLELGMGESLTIVSTVFWTLHITYTDMATEYVDSISMMCIQLGVVTFLSCLAALMLEPQQWFWDHIFVFLPWLIFLAISEGLGFTLMAVGQIYSPPTHAAMILSLEGVFASVASYTFLDETLSYRELSGCFLMLLAALIAKVGVQCIDGVQEHEPEPLEHPRSHKKKHSVPISNDVEMPKLKSDGDSTGEQQGTFLSTVLVMPDFQSEKLKI